MLARAAELASEASDDSAGSSEKDPADDAHVELIVSKCSRQVDCASWKANPKPSTRSTELRNDSDPLGNRIAPVLHSCSSRFDAFAKKYKRGRPR